VPDGKALNDQNACPDFDMANFQHF